MVFTPNTKRFLSTLAAMALLLSACGDGSEEVTRLDNVAEQLVVEATPLADTSYGGLTGETEKAPEDLALVDAIDGEPGASEPFTGDPDSPWCVEMALYGGESNPLSMEIFGLTPAEMEARFTETQEIFIRMEAMAPPEIEPDVQAAAGVFRTFVSLGAEAGWDLDVMLADPGFAAAFDLIGLESAISQIERYTLDVCGIDLT